MHTTFLTLTLAAVLAGGPGGPDTPRNPHPLAPSLPELTPEEEAKYDQVIDQFIRYDTGVLKGDAARRKALRDFKALPPEAIPALIRGLNRAALIEGSCPALVISQKLERMLTASNDTKLLEFARDEIGSGVGKTRHAAVLQDLRVRCMLRKNALLRQGELTARRREPTLTTPRDRGEKSPKRMTLEELSEAVGTVRGEKLKGVLVELETRQGPEVVAGLAYAADNYEADIRTLGRDLLDRHLARQDDASVRGELKDEKAPVRRAAARAGAKRPALGGDLIGLLADDNAEVRAAAHDALVRLARGEDFGPAAGDDKAAREAAQEKWRAWWARRGDR